MKIYLWLSVMVVALALGGFLLRRTEHSVPMQVLPDIPAVSTSTNSAPDVVPILEARSTPESGLPQGQGTIRLALGEEGLISGLALRADTILEDSRCPVDVRCIWAGTVRVGVSVGVKGMGETLVFEPRETHVWDGYSITLTQIEPIPKSSVEKNPEDYSLTFIVTRTQ